MEVLDIYHHAMTLMLNEKLYTAPLSKNIKNALDVGTGTGKAHPPTPQGSNSTPSLPVTLSPDEYITRSVSVTHVVLEYLLTDVYKQGFGQCKINFWTLNVFLR